MSMHSISKPVTILLHLSVWMAVLVFAMVTSPDYPADIRENLVNVGSILVQVAAFFYINYLLLIPRMLIRKKIFLYIISLIVVFIGSLIIFNIAGGFFFTPQPPPGLEAPPPPPGGGIHIRGLLIFILSAVLSTGIRMTMEWFRSERQRKEMENEKIRAEFAALRAQINPHFFFNVLNSICSLARSKSDDTESYIIKLSELLRYNIYEQKDDKVSLMKELHFIENYIDIQKIRLTGDVTVDFQQSGIEEEHVIEPMLLFPFVENAFKHGISYDKPSQIGIHVSVSGNELFFEVRNTVVKNQYQLVEKDAGIGLQNVRRRLDLLYPGSHTLSVNANDIEFTVLLKITLA